MAAALNFQDRIVQPQAPFPVNQGKAFMCLDADGTTIRRFTFEECHNTYFVLFFFPMDFKCDSSEVRAFTRLMPQFTENHTKVNNKRINLLFLPAVLFVLSRLNFQDNTVVYKKIYNIYKSEMQMTK